MWRWISTLLIFLLVKQFFGKFKDICLQTWNAHGFELTFFYEHSISIVEKDFTLILGVIVSDTLARPFFKYLGHINDLHTWQFPTGRQTGLDKIKIGWKSGMLCRNLLWLVDIKRGVKT